MLPRLALCLLLLLASLPAAARDVRQLGPGGDGGCPDATASEDPADADRAPMRRNATVAKPKVSVGRGGDSPSIRAPRWHSFLPGMFR